MKWRLCFFSKLSSENSNTDSLPNLNPPFVRSATTLFCLYFRQIRECLKLDPDHQKCFNFYKKVKKFAKMKGRICFILYLTDHLINLETMNDLIAKEDWMGCLDKGQQMLKQEKEVEAIQLDVYKRTCKCNREVAIYANYFWGKLRYFSQCHNVVMLICLSLNQHENSIHFKICFFLFRAWVSIFHLKKTEYFTF